MSVDWNSARVESTTHLQNLLRFNTTNPPGNETPAANYIISVARSAGLEAQLAESAPGRGNAIVRFRAANPTAKPLLLMGHLDVVGVEREKWTRDPFGGEIVDDFVWGRGALDMKGQVAAELTTLLMLKRRGAELDRDVILAAFADEEVTTGEHGATWMWEERRDLIDAEYAINEGGGWHATVAKKRFYLCQVGEKGATRLRIVARGPAGHASVPIGNTAMAKLGVALTLLVNREVPIVVTPIARSMLESMGSALGDAGVESVKAVLAAPTWDAIMALPLDDESRQELQAIFSNTAVPTIVRGGSQINVIPSEVSVDVDGRILPGVDPEAFRAEIQAAVGDDVEVQIVSEEKGIEAEPDSPLFDAIAATMSELDPGSGVAPYLCVGGTDAKALPGIKVYGFYPNAPSDRQKMYIPLLHGHDERVAIDDLAFGTKFVYELVDRFAGGR